MPILQGVYRSRLWLFVIPILLAQPVQAAEVLRGGIFPSNIGEWCDNSNHDLNGYWSNTTGRTIYIKGFHFWQGTDADLHADLGMALYRVVNESPELVHWVGFDRYVIPSNSVTTAHILAPDWISLPPGGYLSLHRYCYTPMTSPRRFLQTVSFWYTFAPDETP